MPARSFSNPRSQPFLRDTLPDTVRKWKQWWGRLIREEDQKGLLVMLDPKLNTASYGKTFIKALPAGAKATHLDDPGTRSPPMTSLCSG